MLRIGVLALQGSFREHATTLKRCGVEPVEVRTAQQLHSCAGLIIPGGESTTMAHIAAKDGMLQELHKFVVDNRKPVWGTCAGLIFLAKSAEGAKQGGQVLLGCMDVHVSRNFFGAQIASFEQALPLHESVRAPPGVASAASGSDTFRAVFIRAPAILEAGAGVSVLAEYTLSPEEAAKHGRSTVIVAARSENMLATAFHPELTDDSRWHQVFINMVKDAAAAAPQEQEALVDSQEALRERAIRPATIPADLPVFGVAHPCAATSS